MSGKRRRDEVRNKDSPSDEDDLLECEDGMSIPNLNYTVEELSDGNLAYFETEGIEVQATDVLTIEEITNHPCIEHCAGQNSADKVLYEFPTESDEENCNQLSHTYFDNSDISCFQEKADACDVNGAHSFSWTNEKQKNKILKKKKNKEGIVSENDWENDQAISTKMSAKNKENLKVEKGASLKLHNHRSQKVKILNFNCSCEDSELSNTKNTVKWPGHSSDEFADFEDSSASDSVEVIFELKKEPTASAKSMKSNHEHSVPHKSGSQSRLVPVTSSSSSESPASESDEKKSRSASEKNRECSDNYFSQGAAKRIKTTPGDNSAEGKNKFRGNMSTMAEIPGKLDAGSSSPGASSLKSFDFPQDSSIKIKAVAPNKKAAGPKNKSIGEMSTIVEVPEENEASSAPFRNTLKMKTSVGFKKTKCNVCNVRLGLCAIQCRCGGYYCAKHRYDKEHDCTYDYKALGAEEIRKNNPRVVAEKVRKL